MTVLHLAIAGGIGVMVLVLLANLAGFRRVRPDARPRTTPAVSVLVPARNEEASIGGCVASLLAQEYPLLEVLVLDDHSEDGTAAVVGAIERTDPRVRLVPGADLPEGWVGKSFACHQLSQAAKGDLLLFVDADTVHEPSSIGAAVAEMERTGAGLLSLIPHQIMRSFWERTFLPLLQFSTMCFLPFALVSRTRSPLLAMANGQFMLFRRSVYDDIGGHASVHAAMVEDVWLARAVKRRGHRLVVADGGRTVSCRMYTSFRAIWRGFSKNLCAGFGYSVPSLAAVTGFNALTSIAPFFLLPAALVAGQTGWLIAAPAAEVAALLGIRVVLALRFRMGLAPVALHPLAVGLLVVIAANSCRWAFTGGPRWKGRRYDLRRALTGGGPRSLGHRKGLQCLC